MTRNNVAYRQYDNVPFSVPARGKHRGTQHGVYKRGTRISRAK